MSIECHGRVPLLTKSGLPIGRRRERTGKKKCEKRTMFVRRLLGAKSQAYNESDRELHSFITVSVLRCDYNNVHGAASKRVKRVGG